MAVHEKKLSAKYICNFSASSASHLVENLLSEFVPCKNKFVCLAIGLQHCKFHISCYERSKYESDEKTAWPTTSTFSKCCLAGLSSSRGEKFFLVHNKNMFIVVWAGSANQRAQIWKAGYQAAKLARPDISLDVTLSRTGNQFPTLCNTI